MFFRGRTIFRCMMTAFSFSVYSALIESQIAKSMDGRGACLKGLLAIWSSSIEGLFDGALSKGHL